MSEDHWRQPVVSVRGRELRARNHILRLLDQLQNSLGLPIVVISHDRPLSPGQLRRTGADPAPPDGPDACVFAARCPFAAADCTAQPALEKVGDRWSAACHRHQEWAALASNRPARP
jgi:ABC-type dipeptide/oligopeptide/nickel transport system ATPase component